MKKIECKECCKTIGYVKDDFVDIEDDDCLCEECYKKAKEKRVDFTILQRPSEVKFDCPFCGEEVRVDWESFPYSDTYWGDIPGEEIECPHCNEYVTLGYYDVD